MLNSAGFRVQSHLDQWIQETRRFRFIFRWWRSHTNDRDPVSDVKGFALLVASVWKEDLKILLTEVAITPDQELVQDLLFHSLLVYVVDLPIGRAQRPISRSGNCASQQSLPVASVLPDMSTVR